MNRLHRIRIILAALAATFAPSLAAEDIDLYRGNENSAYAANVLIILDSGANWASTVSSSWSNSLCGTGGKYFCYAKSALRSVIRGLTGVSNLNVGLMMSTGSGGYVRFAMRDVGNSTVRTQLADKLIYSLTNNTLIAENDEPSYRHNPFLAALSAFIRPAYAAGNYSDKGNNTDMSLMLNEAYRYFNAMAPKYSGNSPFKLSSSVSSSDARDRGKIQYIEYESNNTTQKDNLGSYDFGDNGAYTSSQATLYKGLPPTAGCGRNYILYIGNGLPSGSKEGEARNDALTNFANFTQLPNGAVSGYYGDSFANYMNSGAAAKRVRTFTIDIAPKTTGSGPDNTRLLMAMANLGGGTYSSANSAEDLIDDIQRFFDQIQSVNSVTASVALPVSVNVRGTYLNQIYMGMYRPVVQPRWFGNLKLYQLAVDARDPAGLTFRMVDSTGNTEVAHPVTGFVANEAISFWTRPSSFWNYRCTYFSWSWWDWGSLRNLPNADPVICGYSINGSSLGSDSPDGAVVEKGGAGQMLREQFDASDFNNTLANTNPARKVYTCRTCTANAALASTPFNTTAIDPNDSANQAAFGATDSGYSNATTGSSGRAGETRDLINWVRGVDNTASTENSWYSRRARPSMPGDVIHSRPVIVNYNTTASGCTDSANGDKDVVAFYAGNDGLLRALTGGTNSIPNAGRELWAFVPAEFYGDFRRLRNNAPNVSLPSAVPAGANNKRWLIDGPLTVYAKDANKDCRYTVGSGDQLYLFMPMRRGGRFMYAFDVLDKNNPKFLWKRSNLDSGFEELGQTWSQLTPITLADGTAAVIVGAGYDPAAEDLPYVDGAYSGAPASPTMGRGVFVLNASNGNIIRRFGPSDGMVYSVPAAVTAISDSTTGKVIYAYVGDTGGNLWKFDLTDATPSNWTLIKLASLGNPADTQRTGVHARRFLYPPDVVRISGGFGVLIGSGDREKPLDKVARNRFFMIKDKPGMSYPILCEGDGSSCGLDNATGGAPVNPNGNGWYINLDVGEKVVSGATTVSGKTFFTTNTIVNPNQDPCVTNLGTAYIYAVNYLTGGGNFFGDGIRDEIEGGGFPPTPVAVLMRLTYQDTSGKTKSRFYRGVISGTKLIQMGTADVNRRTFMYWYKESVD